MRALARWGVMPLLAAPVGASALGLGDIELHSALNQPFEAEIELVSATPEELDGLKVQLAPRETFERYGLDRPEFLSSLEFELAKNNLGRDVVRVTSSRSITEPFVTMLVEVSWPRGRTLREYTVLLDPPVLLPQPAAAAVSAPTTRPAESGSGTIARPSPRRTPAPSSAAAAEPPASGAPSGQLSSDGTTYGPVQRAETLWGIANRIRPANVSVNRMMVAIYEANPQAFDGNMNLLLRGAVLRIPSSDELASLTAAVANAEVRRQNEAWRGSVTEEPRVRLLPPSDAPSEPSAAAAGARSEASSGAATAALESEVETLRSQLEESRRLLALRDEELRALQERLAAAEEAALAAAEPQPPAAPAEEPPAAPGVDLEVEQVFAEEAPPEPVPEQAPAAEEPVPEPVAEAPTPAPERAPAPAAAQESSFLSSLLGWVMNPILLIGLGVIASLLAVIGFLRRRREQEPEDVTGRWDALEQEIAEEERAETERMRGPADEGGFVVEEQSARRVRTEPALGDDADEAAAAPHKAQPVASDETLSTQTVIDLDQADPVAEADFHMAYGLYDQAAELITKALESDPDRRDLKLKLLEVYFVWGNKESFLATAKKLREEMGASPDADWDKVVIMGKQICPDERLFAGAASAAAVDVDLEAGGSPALDLAFEDDKGDALDIDLTGDDGEEDRSAADRFAAAARDQGVQRGDDDSLDIGERTAAGLEAALLADDDDKDDTASATRPDMDIDSLAVTQESPTVERPGAGDWSSLTLESPTTELAGGDAPTVETPTVETAGPDAPTMETPTIETQYRPAEAPTVEQRGIAEDGTAEIDLDDLGLDVSDLQSLPSDFGDLPAGEATAETPAPDALGSDSDLLSATGVTQVLSSEEEFAERETAVLDDNDATMLASLDDDTMTGTEVLDSRFQTDETGSTSLVKNLRKDGDSGLDLDLDDLSAALQGGDTVEQPRGFGTEVFAADGYTPVDLDVGRDVSGSDDPTGTEEISPLDPQTMTEVGTKLDLARAYIDMGDPEGARSILEEVLDEGDPSQRREAQGLIDALSA
ncbi:MAG TPA: FimV/HubP family polar landmark protein [Gammaproteobacteria bacterium]